MVLIVILKYISLKILKNFKAAVGQEGLPLHLNFIAV